MNYLLITSIDEIRQQIFISLHAENYKMEMKVITYYFLYKILKKKFA